MIQRILERGKTSGREDDNIKSLQKRFRKSLSYDARNLLKTGHLETHHELVQPVIKYLENQGKVVKVWVQV